MLSTLLTIFFDLLYHQLAWSYDLVAWTVSLGRWNDWVLSVLDDLPGPCVLELGHGPGHLQEALQQRALHAFGLDRSRFMARLASARLERGGQHVNLVNGAAQALPYPDSSFDQVVATFPSEYIADPATLAEIHRVLKTGGTLLVLPVAWITGEGPLERAAAWLFKVTGQAEESFYRHIQTNMPAGLNVSIEHRQLPGSVVVIIKASKQ